MRAALQWTPIPSSKPMRDNRSSKDSAPDRSAAYVQPRTRASALWGLSLSNTPLLCCGGGTRCTVTRHLLLHSDVLCACTLVALLHVPGQVAQAAGTEVVHTVLIHYSCRGKRELVATCVVHSVDSSI